MLPRQFFYQFLSDYGLCVGAALDEGKVIPKNSPTNSVGDHGFGRSVERLLELFPAWFNTWEWKNDQYSLYSQNNNKGSVDWASLKNQGDYTGDTQTQFNQSGNCKDYPNEGCNPNANVNPVPPAVTFVDEKNQPITNNPTITGNSSLNFILRFRAWASHDQMPIVRLAVDWGDGSDPYVMQGWFKNRKF